MSLVKGYEKDQMNALERILTVLKGEIPDRIPIFPMIDSIPSRYLSLSIEQYYSKANNIIEGQKRLQDLFNLDYVSNFFYLAIESEIFGMKTLFFEEGSPNTGQPIVKDINFFQNNEIPNIYENPIYQKTIRVTKGLADKFKGKKPILSVQSGPFSFPSLLMGTTPWFESILMNPEKVNDVLDYAVEFCKEWAIGQLEAGAEVIVLVDGLATATSIPLDLFKELIIPLYQKLTTKIKAPIIFYTAGGEILPFANFFENMGLIGVFPSANDDLKEFKKVSNHKYTVFGNINNLEFGDWSLDFMNEVIQKTIEMGKPNGQFVLSFQHMIPHNIPNEKIADFISIALKHSFY